MEEAVLRIARMIVASGLPAAASAPPRTKPYRVREMADILGIDQATLYREIQRGHCGAHRVGEGKGAIRIPVDEFEKYKLRIKARAATLLTAVTA